MLRKLLFVSFCVVVWVLFSVFSIFCITSLVSATPRNHPVLGEALSRVQPLTFLVYNIHGKKDTHFVYLILKSASSLTYLPDQSKRLKLELKLYFFIFRVTFDKLK